MEAGKTRMKTSLRRGAGLVIAVALFLINGDHSSFRSKSEGQSHIEEHGDTHHSSRHLLVTHFYENCTPRAINEFPSDLLPYEQRRHGAVVIHIIIVLYAFGALAMICDEYFVDSLEIICDGLKLQEDVAGSTLMAIGSSAPELFTSLIGIFFAKSDIGVGAIVGSAVFNILFTIGLVGLFGGMVIHLKCWPIVRDCVCYMVALCCLLLVMFDQLVHWYEATIMLVLYVFYIALMAYNRKLSDDLIPKLTCYKQNQINIKENGTLEKSYLIECGATNLTHSYTPSYEKLRNGLPVTYGSNTIAQNENQDRRDTEDLESSLSVSIKESEYESPLAFPSSFFGRSFYIIMLPVKIMCFVTIPDCRRPGCWRKTYLATFVMCILWIAAMSYLIVWMVTIIGDTWNIPDTVMGVTLLAVGSSIPDSLNSLIAARQGLGEMAVSNPIGSNIFDIMIGLGFPWFLQTVVIDNGSVVYINSTGLVVGIALLVASVLFLLLLTSLNGWKVNITYAVISLLGYAVTVAFLCLFELNVFGYLNPPPCARSV